MKTPNTMRARWAAAGAAIAVTIGAGGAWVSYAASPPSSVVLIEPARILDTRDGTDLGLPGPFVSPVAQDLQVTGEIPTANGDLTVVPDGATGVLLNVTPVRADADGFISVRPAEAAGDPTTSSLNFTAGETNPNSVQVEVPTSGPGTGQIEISYNALGIAGPSTDILVDVVGYTLASGADPDLVDEIEGLRDDIATLNGEIIALDQAQPFAVSQQLGFTQLGTADRPMVSVRVDAPVRGNVTLVSTMTVDETTEGDEVLCSITNGTTFDQAFTQRWESGGTSDGQQAQLSGVRTFGVGPGTSTVFNVVCRHGGAAGTTTNVDARVLSGIFTPDPVNP